MTSIEIIIDMKNASYITIIAKTCIHYINFFCYINYCVTFYKGFKVDSLHSMILKFLLKWSLLEVWVLKMICHTLTILDPGFT